MTLSQYLDQQGLTGEAFAALIDVNPSTVCRYISGTRSPRFAVLRRIIEVTDGAVGPADFPLNDGTEGEAA